MKAIVWTNHGSPDVLQLREIERPIPKDNEVLIRIRATSVTAGDSELRSLMLPLFFHIAFRIYMVLIRPRGAKILGSEPAGDVEAVGKDVRLFKIGNRVFGATGFHCGAYAKYTCLPEDEALTIMPANMTYEEAAAVPIGGFSALHFLRSAPIKPGQSVLIYGASGSIGTFAVQIAKSFGARLVAVCSGARLELVRSLGADKAIDYTREDFSKSGETFDVVFDAIGKSRFWRGMRSLKRGGVYLLGNPKLSQMLAGILTSLIGGRRGVAKAAEHRTEDLVLFRDLIEAGNLRSVIDRRYRLEQIAEAHAYVDKGQKIGNVVIAI